MSIVQIMSIVEMGCVDTVTLKDFFFSKLKSSNVQLIVNEIQCKWPLPSQVSCQYREFHLWTELEKIQTSALSEFNLFVIMLSNCAFIFFFKSAMITGSCIILH